MSVTVQRYDEDQIVIDGCRRIDSGKEARLSIKMPVGHVGAIGGYDDPECSVIAIGYVHEGEEQCVHYGIAQPHG